MFKPANPVKPQHRADWFRMVGCGGVGDGIQNSVWGGWVSVKGKRCKKKKTKKTWRIPTPLHTYTPASPIATEPPPPKQTHTHAERWMSNKWRQEVSEGPIWEQYCAARASLLPLEASNQGGPFVGGGAVVAEEEAVAVSLGCYLLAYLLPLILSWSAPTDGSTGSPPPPLFISLSYAKLHLIHIINIC